MILMNLFVGKEWRPPCREWTCGHSGGGGSKTKGEGSISICTLSGVRWTAGEKLLCSIGSPVWSSVMTWKDGMSGGEGG